MDDFTLAYDGFDPAEEGLREALTSTGNGYLCTRGTAEWEDADGIHYPGTYAHGVYNRETTIMGGRPVLNEDLVNLPNWLVLKLRSRARTRSGSATSSCSTTGTSSTSATRWSSATLRFRDRAGRETTLRSRRFVSMAACTRPALEWTLTPENWSGRVEVVSAIDGRVTNAASPATAQLEGRHLDPLSPADVRPRGHRAEGRDPPVQHLRRRGRAHARFPRRRGAPGRAQPVPDGGLHPAGPRLRRAAGRAGAGREAGGALHVARPRDQRPAEQRRQSASRATRLRRRRSTATRARGTSCGEVCDVRMPRERARPAAAAAAHLAHPAGLLSAHRRPRRRRARPRTQRRGVPRARLLGRALRLPVPQLPAARRSRAGC